MIEIIEGLAYSLGRALIVKRLSAAKAGGYSRLVEISIVETFLLQQLPRSSDEPPRY